MVVYFVVATGMLHFLINIINNSVKFKFINVNVTDIEVLILNYVFHIGGPEAHQ